MIKIVQIFFIAWFKFPSIKLKKKKLQWKAYIKSLINHFKKFFYNISIYHKKFLKLFLPKFPIYIFPNCNQEGL